MAINRKYWQWIEQAITAFWSQKLMTTRLSIGFGGLLASSVALQVLPSWLYVYMKPHRIYAELAKSLWNAYAESTWPALLLIPTLVSTFLPDTFALIPSNLVLGRWCWHWCWYWYKAGENSKKYDPFSRQTLNITLPWTKLMFDQDRWMGLIEIYDGLNWVTGSRKGQTLYIYKKIPQPQILRQKNYAKRSGICHIC